MSDLAFSIVVCCYNGEDYIQHALESLEAQHYPRDAYEIIVVDDCSTDNTAAIVQSFKNVRMIRHDRNKGIATARNTGMQAAKGHYVAYMDDDCTADEQWLRELEVTLSQPNTVGAGGLIAAKSLKYITQRYLVRSGYGRPAALELGAAKSPWGRLSAYAKDAFKRASQQRPESTEVCEVYGANAAFPREKLLEVNGFPEELRTSEDAAVCNRVRTQNPDQAIRFNPEAKVKHGFASSFAEYLTKIFYRQVDTLRYHKTQQKFPPIFPSPLVFFATTATASFVAWWLALVAAVALPLALYAWWTFDATRSKRLEPLVYTYMQLIEEGVRDAGLIKALFHRQPRPYISLTLVVLALVAGLFLVRHAHVPWLYLPLTFAVVVVPGYLLLRCLAVWGRIANMLLRFALSTVSGLGILLLLGFATAGLLPMLGIDRPLTSVPLLSVYGALLTVLTVGALWRKQPTPTVSAPRVNSLSIILMGVGAMLPVLSLAGANLLNAGGANVITIGMFCLAMALIAAALWRHSSLSPSVLPFTLFVVSLSAVWSYTARSPYLFGWDIQQEFEVFLNTQATGGWLVGAAHTPYDAMLSLTVLPSMLSHLSGLPGMAVFKFFFPVIFSLVPVLLYYAYCLCAKRWLAFTAAALFISQFYYLQQFSALGRQQIGFLFFVGLLYLLFQAVIRGFPRALLIALAGFGLIVSHYSTAYVAIALLAGGYLAAKIGSRMWQGRFTTPSHLSGWIIVSLIAGAMLWYGPITQSSVALQHVMQPSNYSKLVDNAAKRFDAQNSEPTMITRDTYLESIGGHYREDKPYLSYYPDASNQDIELRTEEQIPDSIPLFHQLVLALDTFLRYSWWILGAIGVAWAVLRVKHKFVYEDTEATMLAAVGVTAFILIHLLPEVYYNISRLNQQALIFIALPAVVVLSWVVQRYFERLQKAIIAMFVLAAFMIATGLATVIAGGTPTANLYNAGADYQRFYIHQSEIAAAEWLESQHRPGDVVFADRYGNLRLVAMTDIHNGVMTDITPETLATGSYVYASYANTTDGVTKGYADGDVITFDFPRVFLEQHKDKLYSNGSAEVYK